MAAPLSRRLFSGRTFLGALAVVCVLGLIGVWWSAPPDPRYTGKPLSEYLYDSTPPGVFIMVQPPANLGDVTGHFKTSQPGSNQNRPL